VQGRHPQQIMAVAGLASVHGLVIAIPVTLSLPFWNDQVERFSDGFLLGEAKYALGRRIPENDVAPGVGHDHAVADGLEQLFEVDGCFHDVASVVLVIKKRPAPCQKPDAILEIGQGVAYTALASCIAAICCAL
jgi:hypothetical protein